MSVELTPDPESTSNFHDPVHLDIESLSEITNKPLAIVYYGDQFDPNKDFHVITLDEPSTARRKCLTISIIVGIIFVLLLAALIYTITKIP